MLCKFLSYPAKTLLMISSELILTIPICNWEKRHTHTPVPSIYIISVGNLLWKISIDFNGAYFQVNEKQSLREGVTVQLPALHIIQVVHLKCIASQLNTFHGRADM